MWQKFTDSLNFQAVELTYSQNRFTTYIKSFFLYNSRTCTLRAQSSRYSSWRFTDPSGKFRLRGGISLNSMFEIKKNQNHKNMLRNIEGVAKQRFIQGHTLHIHNLHNLVPRLFSRSLFCLDFTDGTIHNRTLLSPTGSR